MYDPILMANKFEQLAYMARDANTEYEKAAVYAAATAIALEFEKISNDYGAYALETVAKARWSICAAVGYDNTDGHSKEQHVTFALDAASMLKEVYFG
jgi:hypothetical protein